MIKVLPVIKMLELYAMQHGFCHTQVGKNAALSELVKKIMEIDDKYRGKLC